MAITVNELQLLFDRERGRNKNVVVLNPSNIQVPGQGQSGAGGMMDMFNAASKLRRLFGSFGGAGVGAGAGAGSGVSSGFFSGATGVGAGSPFFSSGFGAAVPVAGPSGAGLSSGFFGNAGTPFFGSSGTGLNAAASGGSGLGAGIGLGGAFAALYWIVNEASKRSAKPGTREVVTTTNPDGSIRRVNKTVGGRDAVSGIFDLIGKLF